ncbi:peptidoglycan DD-metalloendopeptidase family protein [Oscillochloris sp. ZM17-4]|uniref:peptidoglycan DD-metalloendopeptidase family protein n=1 Tax=Oscillochloris sp. ZM17-4 TaxID=2866714 RepID=UPI001C73BB15|nr:peptidoglycan DD-metalloendopeptidase family protein [Oscillochloris sp. ZM17-4]MBX0330781.1 peptidoglycan DD-metalloendopeptidase family protein [Oscillochloris sp. ZM17-4]
MTPLRTLRTNRALTFLDLAHLTGMPARAIAEAEYGLRALSWREQELLAFVLGVRATDLAPPQQPAHSTALTRPDAHMAGAPALFAIALAATLATAAMRGDLPQINVPMPSLRATHSTPVPEPAVVGAVGDLAISSAKSAAIATYRASLEALAHRAAAHPDPIAPALLQTPMPAAPTPKFQLTAEGPAGCPVQPTAGSVVITQGYGVGSHAPASIWGAIDLAVDGDSDGYADPGATWYTPVVATHDGTIRVDLDSYPAGNHVWVSDEASSWRTGYSHLAIVTVISGQHVRAGEVIGMIGSSGASSGPHLDYQVWDGEVNVNPTELVGC